MNIELEVPHESLRNWVKADAAGPLNGPETKAVMPEQMELSRPEVEHKCLQMGLEIHAVSSDRHLVCDSAFGQPR